MDASIRTQRGVTLIEVLVTVLIIAFGVLGLIGLNVKIATAQADSYQRAQAILLVRDMASRIQANKTNALSYVTSGTLGTGDTATSCSGTGATLDKCEWSLELRGAAETDSSNTKVAQLVGARGCITRISTNPSVYQVTVAWQGSVETVAPSLSCGSGQYESETRRRAISALVPLACLTAPSTTCTTF